MPSWLADTPASWGPERRDIPAEASCRAQSAIGALIGSADFRCVAVRVPRPRSARDRTAADGVHLAAATRKAVAGSDLIDGGRRRVLVSAADPRSTEDGPTEDEAGQQSNHDFPRSSFFRNRCLPTPTDKSRQAAVVSGVLPEGFWPCVSRTDVYQRLPTGRLAPEVIRCCLR